MQRLIIFINMTNSFILTRKFDTSLFLSNAVKLFSLVGEIGWKSDEWLLVKCNEFRNFNLYGKINSE